MSHIDTVQVQIKSLKALATAADKLGCQFKQGQKTFKTWGGFGGQVNKAPCDHAISMRNGRYNNYEVGIVRKGAAWELQLDNYDGELTGLVGRDCARLVKEYAVAVAEQEAQELIAQGWQLHRVDLPSGEVQLTLSDGQD